MKTYIRWIKQQWRPLILGSLLALLTVGFLAFRLGTLNHGATQAEFDYINSLDSGKHLFANPNFFMHKLPTYLLFKLDVQAIAFYRLVSIFFVSATVVSCFLILKRMYTLRIAVLGSFLLLTTAWILHTGRSATPEVSFLLILPMILIARWLHDTNHHTYSLIILSAMVIASFYIPGFFWLALATVIWERKAILAALKAVPWWVRVLCGVGMVVGIVPLVWGVTHNSHVLLDAMGLPVTTPNLRMFASNLLEIPKNLFVFGPNDPARWLGRIPILDLFTITMLVLGAYSVRYNLKQHSMRLMLGGALLITLLISVGGLVTITALLPITYIFVGAGIAFLLQQWLAVFPKNPLAHTLATSLVSITVLLVTYYHVSHYFIAWPQTPATKRVFGHSLVK